MTENTDHCLMKSCVIAEVRYCLWEPVTSSRRKYHTPIYNRHFVWELGCSGAGCGEILLEILEKKNFLHLFDQLHLRMDLCGIIKENKQYEKETATYHLF